MSYVCNRQLRTCLDVSLSRSDILVVLFQVLSEGIDIVLNKSATVIINGKEQHMNRKDPCVYWFCKFKSNNDELSSLLVFAHKIF